MAKSGKGNIKINHLSERDMAAVREYFTADVSIHISKHVDKGFVHWTFAQRVTVENGYRFRDHTHRMTAHLTFDGIETDRKVDYNLSGYALYVKHFFVRPYIDGICRVTLQVRANRYSRLHNIQALMKNEPQMFYDGSLYRPYEFAVHGIAQGAWR